MSSDDDHRDDLRERIAHLAHRIARQWRLITELEIEGRPTAEADALLDELQQEFWVLRAEREAAADRRGLMSAAKALHRS
jgi:hypothetical protein